MKRLTYLFTGLIMVALVVSCSKEATDDSGVALKVATISQQSMPVSNGGITPVILAVDKPKGGNVTCTDVAQAYFTSFALCGDKLDYGDYDNDGDKEFSGAFPLNVTVEGAFVSFSSDGGNCIQIGDKYYKVGAVIVKGSNAANVYFYPDGTLSDSGLASPINASGGPAGLSNLTFCFIECEQIPLVIAFKSYMSNSWACTSGGPADIDFVGWYNFVPDYVGYKIYWSDLATEVGNITISNLDLDANLEVLIDNSLLPTLYFRDGYLFVGSLEDYTSLRSLYGDLFWQHFPYKTGWINPASSITFDLPF
jgi:hypothetical protein